MKKIVLIFFAVILSFPVFADKVDDDTKLIAAALSRIEKLEAEIEKLKNEKKDLIEETVFLRGEIAELDNALAESNIVLQEAYDRIEKDGLEITDLRTTIKTLVANGVEFKSYKWNLMLTSGYPASIGVGVAYNLPFFTNIGIITGFDYYFKEQIPAFKVGLKINLGKD